MTSLVAIPASKLLALGRRGGPVTARILLIARKTGRHRPPMQSRIIQQRADRE
jgi:hypothetical protein